MSVKLLGPFLYTSSIDDVYRSYWNFSKILTIDGQQPLDGDADTQYFASRTMYTMYDSGSDAMSAIGFSFYTEDGTAFQPDVDRGYLRFLNRNLINVLTSRPDDIVIPLEYTPGIQSTNIETYLDYVG